MKLRWNSIYLNARDEKISIHGIKDFIKLRVSFIKTLIIDNTRQGKMFALILNKTS